MTAVTGESGKDSWAGTKHSGEDRDRSLWIGQPDRSEWARRGGQVG
jgi:hypothetical protein